MGEVDEEGLTVGPAALREPTGELLPYTDTPPVALDEADAEGQHTGEGLSLAHRVKEGPALAENCDKEGAAVPLPAPAEDDGTPLAVRPTRVGVTLAQRDVVPDGEPVGDSESTPDGEVETESDGERDGSGDDDDEPVATL